MLKEICALQGTYFFRKVVPKEVRHIVKKTEIKVSLKTTDFKVAASRANEEEAIANLTIQNARSLLAGEDVRISAEQLAVIAKSHTDDQAFAGRLASQYTPEAARNDATSAITERMNSLHFPSVGRDNEIIDELVDSVLEKAVLPRSPFNRNAVRDVLVQARWNGLNLQRRGMQGEAWEAPVPNQSPEPIVAPSADLKMGPLLSTVMEDYFRDVRPTPQTEHEWRQSVSRFSKLHGDVPIAAITASQLRAFRDALPDWGDRRAKGRQPLKGATVNKHLNALGAILNWAVKQGIIEKNELLAVSRPDEGDSIQRRPWSDENLIKIFNGSWYEAGQTRAALFWVPLLALYSGARAGELVQLRCRDVWQEDATWVFAVTSQSDLLDANEQTTAKTKGSRRIVPVHRELERMGFSRFIEGRRQSDEKRLFPEFRRGRMGSIAKMFSSEFSEYIRSLGIENPTQSFHSFRHSFKDRCREAGIPEEVSDRLTGHSNPSVGRRYGAGYSVPKLKEYIDQVSYPRLNLSHLY
ncbi:DUF6538 domain-containing protein [Thalassobaculum sp.]|uniref:tyrosine-type recombinase/integrase n=1 Tax=Thalassobaculum sp. TaxID=2022740 RepID=UPI0032F075A5